MIPASDGLIEEIDHLGYGFSFWRWCFLQSCFHLLLCLKRRWNVRSSPCFPLSSHTLLWALVATYCRGFQGNLFILILLYTDFNLLHLFLLYFFAISFFRQCFGWVISTSNRSYMIRGFLFCCVRLLDYGSILTKSFNLRRWIKQERTFSFSSDGGRRHTTLPPARAAYVFVFPYLGNLYYRLNSKIQAIDIQSFL